FGFSIEISQARHQILCVRKKVSVPKPTYLRQMAIPHVSNDEVTIQFGCFAFLRMPHLSYECPHPRDNARESEGSLLITLDHQVYILLGHTSDPNHHSSLERS